MRLTGIVLDSPDARELAGFYQRLLGWNIRDEEPDWVTLQAPDGGTGLSFQTEPKYVRPGWRVAPPAVGPGSPPPGAWAGASTARNATRARLNPMRARPPGWTWPRPADPPARRPVHPHRPARRRTACAWRRCRSPRSGRPP